LISVPDRAGPSPARFRGIPARAHVRIAFCYLKQHTFADAAERVRSAIKAYNAHNNVPEGPTRGYNETTTIAFLHLVDATMRAYGDVMPTPDSESFCDTHPQLLHKHVLRLFYSPEQRMHPSAKTSFVEPDLTEFPKTPRPATALSAKQLLLTQTAGAFTGRPDMPLMASLKDIAQAEASWQFDPTTPTIEQLVRHIAWAKNRFCQQGFGIEMVLIDESVNDDGDTPDLPYEFPCGAAWGRNLSPGIGGAIDLLQRAHQVLTECLDRCSAETLDQPIPAPHGKTAANFFWTMLMHDIYHAGQIRTRRSMYQAAQFQTRIT
jgi:DinB superfamily